MNVKGLAELGRVRRSRREFSNSRWGWAGKAVEDRPGGLGLGWRGLWGRNEWA